LKVLVASINFAPDHSGIGVYSTDFSTFLSEQGDTVTMVTGFPYYPSWKKHCEDKGVLFRKEVFKGILLLRGYLYVPHKVTPIKRIMHEATFCLFAFLNFLRAGRQDAIVVFSPPFLLGLVGKIFATLWRCPLVINIQDLPLDAATSLGMVNKGFVSKILNLMERWIYYNATEVVTISERMLDSVRTKVECPEKIGVIPNWIDIRCSQGIISGKFRKTHSILKDKFLVVYAGNLGVKQGLDCLLYLAKKMESDRRFHFFLIGNGADKSRLLKISDELQLHNTTFLDLLAPDAYKEMLVDVDLVFIAQRMGGGDNFFPSKVLGVMAQGKPLLVAADLNSELARSIVKWNCGSVVSYSDLNELVKQLKNLSEDNATLQNFGLNGFSSVNSFDRSYVLNKWRNKICNLVHVSKN
jgi:colanic acid biosynthesis glycosyl transferase WcaI